MASSASTVASSYVRKTALTGVVWSRAAVCEPESASRVRASEIAKSRPGCFFSFCVAMQFQGQTLHGEIRRIKVLRRDRSTLKPQAARARRELVTFAFLWLDVCGGVAA